MKLPKLNFQKHIFLAITINCFGAFLIGTKPAQANPQRCYQEALPTFYSKNTADLVAWMCQGAVSTVPAQCFKSALPNFYNDQVARRAAMVCKGAQSTAPGKCFIETIGTFYNSESIERAFKLCQADSTSLPTNNSSEGVYGAWGLEMDNWSGLLRMSGNYGTLVLVSKRGEVVEQRMTLKLNPNGGYILEGKVVTLYNLKNKYYSDNFYIKKFYKNFSARSCDSNQTCSIKKLTYLGE